MERLRVGILGFGNLGRGAAAAVSQSPDMALAGIFTRRPPEQVAAEAGGMPVCPAALLEEGGPPVDVLLLCGGSAGDLPRQSPRYAGRFHIVDSFDTHARAPEHFAAVDAAARRGGRAAVICAGWDPGLFSVLRALALAALPPGGEPHLLGGGGQPGALGGRPPPARRPGRPGVHRARPRRSGGRPGGGGGGADPRLDCTGGCAMWRWRRGRSRRPSGRPLSPCPTILRTTTPRCASSPGKNWPVTTPACPTGGWCCAPAAPGGERPTGPAWSSGYAWTPTRSSPAACWPPAPGQPGGWVRRGVRLQNPPGYPARPAPAL